MKKQLLRCAWLALAFAALLCMSALAAETASENLGAGFYLGKSEAMTIKPVTDEAAKTIEKDSAYYSYYQGAVPKVFFLGALSCRNDQTNRYGGFDWLGHRDL